jgi:hypothetical protein
VRPFAKQQPLARRLSLEARVLYTGFLAFLGFGLASSALLYRDSFGGLTSARASRYYLGETGSMPTQDIAAPNGPTLELPDEPAEAAVGLALAKPPRQLLETFHFHLFTVPVVLLIVGHLFMLTGLSVRSKVVAITVATAATFLHLVAPLAIRFLGQGFGLLMPLSAVAAALGWLPLTLWPVWEMWRPAGLGDDEAF